ncbi:MAG: inositol monophosphatase family protein, partial [Natronospirillum sp.]
MHQRDPNHANARSSVACSSAADNLPHLDVTVLHAIAQEAADRIMEVYRAGFEVGIKEDDSPVTRADQDASAIILNGLRAHSDWPVLSEEDNIPSWTERQRWTTYWLIDPLDGTKEFVKKNGDFSVNIALIHHHRPIQGLILAPVSGDCWWATKGKGARHNTNA